MDISGSVGAVGTPALNGGSLGIGGGAGMGMGMGGGRRRLGHGRSTSLTAGLLSLLSPALGGGGGGGSSHSSVPAGSSSSSFTAGVSTPSRPGFTPGHRSRTSYIGSLFSPVTPSFSIPPPPPPPQSPTTPTQRLAGGGKGVGLGLGVDGSGATNGIVVNGHGHGYGNGVGVQQKMQEREIVPLGMVVDEWDPETALPVFEVRPSMLAVDLALGPGESRSCASNHSPLFAMSSRRPEVDCFRFFFAFGLERY